MRSIIGRINGFGLVIFLIASGVAHSLDDVRLPALKAKAIQATLFNTAASLRAQKDGFTKLASAGEYVNTIQGGIATSDDKIKQQPAKSPASCARA